MLHVCPACRAERRDALVRDGETVVCPECGHERTFVRSPLCIVTGAAGTGKSTVRRRLAGEIDAVLLEDDGIAHEDCTFDEEAEFNEYVLRICRTVAQSSVPPVLFTTGLGVPENVESLTNRRYFGESHYLALTCDPEVQTERLRDRPGWEGSGYWADIDRQVEFNEWFLAEADDLGIETLDTTATEPSETTRGVAQWLRGRLPER